MAWFLHAIEGAYGGWHCQHGRHIIDAHHQLADALAHLAVIGAEMGSYETFVHHGDGTVEQLGDG